MFSDEAFIEEKLQRYEKVSFLGEGQFRRQHRRGQKDQARIPVWSQGRNQSDGFARNQAPARLSS